VVPPNRAFSYHPPFELFDLQRDPWEQNDLAKDPAYAPVLTELRSRLQKHMENTSDPLLAGAVASPMHHRAMNWLRAGSA
jgi:hypothetical protein